MLVSLYIKNYAIIEEVEISFDPHFNVITGETGAGKSILIGALGLILGKRADSKILYRSQAKCIVEATFRLNEDTIRNLPRSEEYDLSIEVVLRREINHSGKSRAFINDSLVRLSTLKYLATHLVEIHNQFDSLSIITPEYQLSMIDALADNSSLLSHYSSIFKKYQTAKTELKGLIRQQSESQQDMDYLLFQLEELNKINLDELNKETLEQEYQTLENSEEIKRILSGISQSIGESDPSIEDQLIDLSRQINSIAELNSQLKEIGEFLHESIELLREVQNKSSYLFGELTYSEDRISELRDTLDHLYLLEKKHRVNSIPDLIDIRNAIQLRTEGTYSIEELIKVKQEELVALTNDLERVADKLTTSRRNQFKPICRQLEEMLHNLAMPNARLAIHHETTEEFSPNGRDLISVHFSANKGVEPQAVSDIASGGEISRLALCVKSLIASQIKIGTLIFDEIDTGISGAVALKVGEILHDLAEKHQVISITHSPQVAANAVKHFFVHKKDTADRTITEVRLLSSSERVEEIAKMLSTDPPTEAAMKNATELLTL